MGNHQTKAQIEKAPIFEVIREEFLSLKQIKPQRVNFEELSNFKIPKTFQGDVDLTRIETLFVLDHDKDGLISLDDVTNFCVIFANTIASGPDWDRANRFNTECVRRLTCAISSEGAEKISKWTLSLVSVSGWSTIPQESVMLLFRLFAPLTGNKMDSLKFFRLLRREDDTVQCISLIEKFLVPFFSSYRLFHEVNNN